MSLNKNGTYRAQTTSNGRLTGWECYRNDCSKVSTGTIELASGATHRACDIHGEPKVCTCGALDHSICFCNLTYNEWAASPRHQRELAL